MKSWRLVGVWVLVLVITTALTWQIVSLASDQVGDAPVAIAPATTTSTLGSSSSTTTHDPTTTSSITRSTNNGSSPTTSTPGDGGTSSSSTSATTPATSSPTEWSLRTITTQGGTVVVRYRPGEVELQAATPAPGFEMEIDDAGPPDVRVEFENDDTDIRVEARWEDGSLDVAVNGDT
jgi:cytoskeletal protein RodZ